MVETLVISLILAALSGLTFVAYKHPRGYRRISIPLGVVVLMLAIWVLSLTSGATVSSIGSLKEDLDHFPDRTLKSEEFSINSLYQCRNRMIVVLMVTVATLGYLYFLSCLPRILECETNTTGSIEAEWKNHVK